MDDIDGPLFLGRLSERLSDLIEAQSAEVFRGVGLQIPVKSCSLVVTIQALEPASAVDLARALGCSHQLVLQKTPKLLALGLVRRTPCPDDGRRKVFSLTPEGREQVARLESLEPALVGAYDELEGTVGGLHAMLRAAIEALQQRTLAERVEARQER